MSVAGAPGKARRSLRDHAEVAFRAYPSGTDRLDRQLRMLRSVPAPVARPLRVLDLGCGDGTMAGRVRAAISPVTVVGLDWTEDALASTRQRGVVVVRASVDDAGLPVRAGAFDAVLFSEVIEHLIDPDLALAEVRRVLVPGGTLLLSTPNLAAWFNRLLLAAGFQPVFSEVSRLGVFGRPGDEVVGHLRLFTARALVEMLSAHGFVQVSLDGATFHGVPRLARGLDRLCARRPSLAAILLAQAQTEAQPLR